MRSEVKGVNKMNINDISEMGAKRADDKKEYDEKMQEQWIRTKNIVILKNIKAYYQLQNDRYQD